MLGLDPLARVKMEGLVPDVHRLRAQALYADGDPVGLRVPARAMGKGVEIKVGARTIIGYFLAPVTRGLGDAMREP